MQWSPKARDIIFACNSCLSHMHTLVQAPGLHCRCKHLTLVACAEESAPPGGFPKGPLLPEVLGCLGLLMCRLPASISLISPDPAQPVCHRPSGRTCARKQSSSASFHTCWLVWLHMQCRRSFTTSCGCVVVAYASLALVICHMQIATNLPVLQLLAYIDIAGYITKRRPVRWLLLLVAQPHIVPQIASDLLLAWQLA